MFKKKLTPEERIAESRKKIVAILDKYKCVLDTKVTISNGKIDQSVQVLALKEENA